MILFVRLTLIVTVPVASVTLLGVLYRWGTGQLHRRPAIRPAPQPPRPARRSIERVAADLRRLGAQCARIPAGAPQTRRRGLQAAYDDVLTEAALLLDVPCTLTTCPPGPARDVERLRLQAELAAAGLVMER